MIRIDTEQIRKSAKEHERDLCYFKGIRIHSPCTIGFMLYKRKFGERGLDSILNVPWQLNILGGAESLFVIATGRIIGKYLKQCVKDGHEADADSYIDFFFKGDDGFYRQEEHGLVGKTREDFIAECKKKDADE